MPVVPNDAFTFDAGTLGFDQGVFGDSALPSRQFTEAEGLTDQQFTIRRVLNYNDPLGLVDAAAPRLLSTYHDPIGLADPVFLFKYTLGIADAEGLTDESVIFNR